MSFYFESIGKKSAVAAAVSESKNLPDHIKTFVILVLNSPTNDAIDSATLLVQGHGGTVKVDIKEFIPAASVPVLTPVGYGDDGKGALAAAAAKPKGNPELEWAMGRIAAQEGKELPADASEASKMGFASWQHPSKSGIVLPPAPEKPTAAATVLADAGKS